jgi:chromatin assembly factor 1 subunit B
VAIPADGGAKPASDAEAAVSAEPAPTVDLPYRVVFAVCTTDTVAVYDTGKETPVAFVSGLHYATITDAAWSPCGMKLVVSSSDGYCSALTFTESELGKVLAPEEVPEHIAHVLPSRRVLSSEKRARVAAEAAKAAAERAAQTQAQTQAPAQVDGGQTKRIAPQPVTADGPKRIAPQPVTADGPKRVMPTPVDAAAPVSVAVGEKRPIESADGGVEKKPQRIAPTPM